MINYSIFHSPRQGGKTHYISQCVSDHRANGQRVAVVVPHERMKRLLGSDINTVVDVYTEATLPGARGRIYDHLYVDEANLFYEDPVEMCAAIHPGVPATFTYTAYPFEGVSP